MDKLIELKDIHKVFKSHKLISVKKDDYVAVNGVSLEIRKNTIFGLVGESGCGKTTLARSVMLLDPPSSGEILFKGDGITNLTGKKLKGFRSKIQIVFQDPNSALNPKMSIYNCMKEGLVNRKYPKAQLEGRIRELLDMVGISPGHMNRFPHEFSGGQKQRIVIARALSMEPEFLVLDEPVSNLDVSIQAQIINLLLDLKEKFSLTYLFISHDLNLVSYLSDHVAVMLKGQIVETAETDLIMKTPLHPYTLKLFSSAPGQDSKELFEADENYRKGLPSGYTYFPPEPESLLHLVDTGNGHRVGCYETGGL
ncbi:MAG: ABC transporter ATP-binding protein [Spirochaetaceae bacterium]|nr:ABC transporter ATP-binding protein [Spirochaetaceae bacterium]